MWGRRQPAKVLVWSLIRVQIIHLRVLTEITNFPSDFRTSTQHYNYSETSLKKNYSSDRALFDLNKEYEVYGVNVILLSPPRLTPCGPLT